MTTQPRFEQHLGLAHALADAAGPIALRYFRGLDASAIEDKADLSPVTVADKEIEATLRALLERRAPGHGILGEEHGSRDLDAEWVWVIDPIDGTKSFLAGVPMFTTLLGLCWRGTPVLGIIDQPFTRERWVGVVGQGASWNGRPTAARPGIALSQARLYCTTADMFRGAELGAWERLSGAVKMRRYGCDGYAFGLLASGQIDLVLESSLQDYDWAAPAAVIEAAGGVLTDWEGRPPVIGRTKRVLAAGSAALHAAALELVNAG